MKIKKGDTVKMLKGKDRGRTGKVIQLYSDKRRVTVEGLNIVKKHVKKEGEREQGGIVSVPRAVNIATVQLVCPKCNKPTRVLYKITKSGKKKRKSRVCKKCESEIDAQKADKKKEKKK